jgi:rRNA maturation protein Nop10
MTAYTPENGCPKCGGQSGYSFTMTEEHAMGGAWGAMASSGDNGNQRYSLVSCEDCGHKFQMQTLHNLGAITGEGSAGVQRFE